MQIPEVVSQIIERLEQAGHEAWIVGGCVRDALLGIQPHDWDLCTSALPQETAACFPDDPIFRMGEKHGTITVRIQHENYEITTYRTEKNYMDHRRPEQVKFVSNIREDLIRRDFTVNAMAYHPQRGLCDLFGGQADLQAGIIRCVGNANQRFTEDALRILRGLRFAATYQFRIDAETVQGMKQQAYLLEQISRERIFVELQKLLSAKVPSDYFRGFESVWNVIFPEFAPMQDCMQNHPFHDKTVWEHSLAVLDAVPNVLELRLAALFHDMGKPSCKTTDEKGTDHFYGHPAVSETMARSILNRLRTSKQIREDVCFFVKYHDVNLPEDQKQMRHFLSKYGKESGLMLLQLHQADNKGQSAYAQEQLREKIKTAFSLYETCVAESDCFSRKDLAVTGKDLLQIGIPADQRLGRVIDHILEEVLSGKLQNKKSCILQYVNASYPEITLPEHK